MEIGQRWGNSEPVGASPVAGVWAGATRSAQIARMGRRWDAGMARVLLPGRVSAMARFVAAAQSGFTGNDDGK